MPLSSKPPVRCWVIVILIALPMHTVDLLDVAVDVCPGNLPIIAFAVRGHCTRRRLAHCFPCCAWPLPLQRFTHRCTPCAGRQLARHPHCRACRRFARRHPCRAWPSQAWQFTRHCPCLAWPSQARQFAHTHARRANYLPNIALAAHVIDFPIIALAAHAGNALLSPASGCTLPLIASC